MRLLFAAMFFGALFGFGGATAFGQAVGSTEQAVLASYGAPQLERNQGGKKIWIYSNGTRVVFVNGRVTETNVSDAQAAPTLRTEVEAPPVRTSAPTASKSKAQPSPTPRSKSVPAAPTESQDRVSSKDPGAAALQFIYIGLALSTIGGIWFIGATFQYSLLWGLACLFIPGASLVFMFRHWQESKKPFFVSLLGMPFVMFGVYKISQLG